MVHGNEPAAVHDGPVVLEFPRAPAPELIFHPLQFDWLSDVPSVATPDQIFEA